LPNAPFAMYHHCCQLRLIKPAIYQKKTASLLIPHHFWWQPLRGSNSHCSVWSLANSVNLAKKNKAPLTYSYQRCEYEKQPPPKKMFATVLEDTFFETWEPKKCNMFAYSNYLFYRDWKFGTWHTHLRFGWHHQICCAFVPVWYCPA
jgi:hypothetical protein